MNKKKFIGDLIDLALIAVILIFFYYRAFVDGHHVGRDGAGTMWLRFIAAMASIIVLIFRIHRHPKLARFATHNNSGEMRVFFLWPAACVAAIFAGARIVIRVLVILTENTTR
ncbi:hypothetical protein [Burkholderia pyrrocinia]|uniref:hypothetical protein n=1 Tax=Burkholderia pyrrocinia TaxID=60550 RepID=UPI001260132B|nr:hypothetical protein [Burkholderia pyrrocinia]